MDTKETLATFQLDDSDANRLATILQGFQDNLKNQADELRNKDLKIQALTLELAHLRRIRYGVKNEALSGLQRDLFEESYNEDVAAVTEHVEQLAVSKPKRSRDDITEQLDVEPARFFVHRHIRPQYACNHCETITAAPIPPSVIDGGMAAVGLLTWVLTSKYLDHLPLYRLEQIAARNQVKLSRSTLADWVGRTGVALEPLVDRLIWHLLQGNSLHADSTTRSRQRQNPQSLPVGLPEQRPDHRSAAGDLRLSRQPEWFACP